MPTHTYIHFIFSYRYGAAPLEWLLQEVYRLYKRPLLEGLSIEWPSGKPFARAALLGVLSIVKGFVNAY